MYIGFTHLHSSLRYLLLLLLVVSLVLAFSGKKGDVKKFTGIFKVTFILTHVQLLVGLVLYFISPQVKPMWKDFSLISENTMLRFYGLEHALAMILAVAMITVGWVRYKKAPDEVKAHTIIRFWGIALLIIFVMIPWPFMRDFGTWF